MHHQLDTFSRRHIGPTASETTQMLQTVGVSSLEELIDQTIPASIRLEKKLNLTPALTEQAYLEHIRTQADKNQLWKSYIGMGYYDTIVPPVIQRNIFENPGWYTQYTPYQAEISQGRLEALLNFQTLVSDLTGMDMANASLLDEGTAAAEAMMMLHRIKNKRARGKTADVFLVADTCLPASIEVMKTRAEPLGIELKIGNYADFQFDENVFGLIVQYPAQDGAIYDYSTLAQKAKKAGAYVVVAADLLSLTLLTPPGEWGADVVVGNTQRLGVPMGYGGPHAAYFAASQEFARQAPGRIIGVSIDASGKPAYRMALQTREQHIRREKATSNICTAQALLGIMASMYAVYHGPDGLRHIAQKVHSLTTLLDQQLTALGYEQVNEHYFDTLLINLKNHPDTSGLRVRRVAELDEINFRYFEDSDWIGISLDESCTIADVERISRVFAEAINAPEQPITKQESETASTQLPTSLHRSSEFLTHPVFNSHHSETQMLRYIKKLESRDLSLAYSMIPLGSCTMKLNATSQLMPLSWAKFSQLHPFVPIEQATGYQEILAELASDLCEITGFDACAFQPNSGAQGEYAGLMVIRAYHRDRGDTDRNVVLIPSSAHGTNPASGVMAGMKVVVVKCDDNGNIDVADLQAKAEKHADVLSALMVTYPSTHGVFETAIQEVCNIVHQYGGQVYMDGANMNAQVGLTNPGLIGADVCHLNLHKTFSIPHGGGGPGMGPICVAAHLSPYLPGHIFSTQNPEKAISAVSSAPYGSASILLISYGYIKMLGAKGATDASRYAILNANYLKTRLEKHFDILYVGENGRVAHELILDFRPFKNTIDIGVEDIAKRFMDYGFHAPTVSFPVSNTIMIEPTESEAKDELDRFCEAMITIREEMNALETETADKTDNVLKNAPHTIAELIADEWTHPYTRSKAAYPLAYLREHKFWTPVSRINNVHGDKNLICSCPPIEMYE